MRDTSGYFLSDLIGFVVEVRSKLSSISHWQREDAERDASLEKGLVERLTYLVSFSMSLDELLADVLKDMGVPIDSNFTIAFSAFESVEVDVSKPVPGKGPLDLPCPFDYTQRYRVVIGGFDGPYDWDHEMNWRHRNRLEKIRGDFRNNPRFKCPPDYSAA